MALQQNNNQSSLFNRLLEEIDQKIADMEQAELDHYRNGGDAGNLILPAATAERTQRRQQQEEQVIRYQAGQQARFNPITGQMEGGTKEFPMGTVGDIDKPVEKVGKKIYESQTPEERAAYKQMYDRFQESQDVLRQALIKKHPEAGDLIESIGKELQWNRQSYYENLPDYYLTPQEIKQAFGGGEQGDQKYMQYVQDVKGMKSALGEEWSDLYKTKGTKEPLSTNDILFGTRTATLGYYTGDVAPEERVRLAKEYAESQGYQKEY